MPSPILDGSFMDDLTSLRQSLRKLPEENLEEMVEAATEARKLAEHFYGRHGGISARFAEEVSTKWLLGTVARAVMRKREA
ncbi:MAG: hypothetical protein UT19_C0002G0012 [Candidatus Woesebacteria bacterium GW2011_GWB1_39_10b]|uniref:Uncharacterized protein n=4 Tax=Microgenomates group TaxID=1794810 RepID=A0A0H4TAM2_9BACT|nr:hypothetical protein [uncultured Microgenomates bacterium Rifle_16ft_4_minimus_954]KKQ51968.1 MAG: hypothetical protein US72_C0011G0067 [Microgenomates group bacterium GW2011_GWC1_38_12]KKQ94370.1 MAG: hypothetical protein UT19_C0002G0012 [Candidatus Woesebacteria bacterium GW2011_GWB1_39_10b]KKR14382.1 MAG: hypothetical protein UT40_C0001G0012 [Candidatus Woesebacteria bacterium GW2011_GWA1_39_21b]